MSNKKTNISVEVATPLRETKSAILLIRSLLEKNNIQMNLKIIYDYECKEMGFYLNNDKARKIIFINPLNCKNSKSLERGESGYPGFTKDLSVFGVTIHEFCHLLQFENFNTILRDYAREFPTDRLYLNEYSNNALHDEVAEAMALYITNPLILKMISIKHWHFFKKYFKSPVACSQERSFKIYKNWPINIKNKLKTSWGITYDEYKKKLVRLENEREV